MLLEYLDKAIQSVENKTYKLIFADRETTVEALKQSDQYRVINLSEHLANALLPLRGKVRIRQLGKALSDLIDDSDQYVVLDRIELLFEPSLEQQPLQRLKQLSRYTTLIVLWPGIIKDGQLTYAQPMHSEYQNYSSNDLNDILVITPAHY